jgi:predicted amidohydrolase
MKNLKIATAQFENKSGDNYNLSVIEKLSQKGISKGCDVISFHECSITGYTFARNLSKEQMLDLAELIPSGESILKLIEIAGNNNIVILAGLLKKTKTTIYSKLTFA